MLWKCINALERRKESAAQEGPRAKLATDLISSHRSKSYGNKKEVLSFIKNWVLDNYPLVLEFVHVSRTALASIGMTLKKTMGKRKEMMRLMIDGQRHGSAHVLRNLMTRECSTLRDISVLGN